jgi:hypothetical protein
MDEMKLPVPEPLLVFVVKDIVGFALVDHTNPLEVTAEPPSALTFPTEIAVVDVIDEIEVVVTVGGIEPVVKVISSPYPVPLLLVAYVLKKYF